MNLYHGKENNMEILLKGDCKKIKCVQGEKEKMIYNGEKEESRNKFGGCGI